MVLPAAFPELGVVLLHLRLALLDRRVEQEYEPRQRERPYDVGRGVPQLRAVETINKKGVRDKARHGTERNRTEQNRKNGKRRRGGTKRQEQGRRAGGEGESRRQQKAAHAAGVERAFLEIDWSAGNHFAVRAPDRTLRAEAILDRPCSFRPGTYVDMAENERPEMYVKLERSMGPVTRVCCSHPPARSLEQPRATETLLDSTTV